MLFKFPILWVPHLVLAEIINQIELGDLIALSLCSKNIFLLIQFHCTNTKATTLVLTRSNDIDYAIGDAWKVGGRLDGKFIFAASRIEDHSSEKTEIVRVGNQCVPVMIDKKRRCLRTFWVDQMKGFRFVTSHVTKLLKKDIEMVFIDVDSLWMMDWIKTVQTGLRVAHIGSTESFTEEQYVNILENCEANIVMLNAKPPQSFKYKNKFPEMEFVSFEHGFWITLENLLNMKLSSVYINESKLTTADMNVFLKHWLSGGSPQLKFLCIQIDGNVGALLSGLKGKMRRIRNHREFDLNLDYQKPMYFSESIEIRQENGNRATFFYFRSTKTFQMVVGDDFIEPSF